MGNQNDFLQLLQNTHHPASYLVQLLLDVFRYFLSNSVCRDCYLNIYLCVCDEYYTHPLNFHYMVGTESLLLFLGTQSVCLLQLLHLVGCCG